MNLRFYFEKLMNSEAYRNFIKKNPGAFVCSAFFVIDKQGKGDKQHFDFYVPAKSKIFSFMVEEDFRLVELEGVGGKDSNKRDGKLFEEIKFFDIDFKGLERIILERMREEGIKKDIERLLFSLQSYKGKMLLIGSIFLSGLGLLNVKISVPDLQILSFERLSFFDFFKVFKRNNKNKKKGRG